MSHFYPHHLVEMLYIRWNAVGSDELPNSDVLNSLISTCYQASIMMEEERSLQFRLMLIDPDRLPAGDGPPDGLYRLIFNEPRIFSEYELRKLAPAVDYYGSLIGVKVNAAGVLHIWGIVHSGQRWIQAIQGGSLGYSPLPESLVLHVVRAGQIVLYKGSEMIAMLSNGRILNPSTSVLNARWLKESLDGTTMDLWSRHNAARSMAAEPWAMLERNFPILISQQITKRIMSIVSNSRHGGTIISISPERSREISSKKNYVDIRYQFKEEEQRNRFRTLLLDIMKTLAESYGDAGRLDRIVGWKEYIASKNDALRKLDEALYEYAHFVAGLAAVDGVVIMTSRHELIGFGGIILGPFDKAKIGRSLDSEGASPELESLQRVGMRHRAAYHLCNEMHDAIAMIISQDGDVNVARWNNGIVQCWNVLPYPHFYEDAAATEATKSS